MIRLAGQSGTYKFHEAYLYDISDVDYISLATNYVITHGKNIKTGQVRVTRLYDDLSELIVQDLYYAGGHEGFFIRDMDLNSVTLNFGATNIPKGQSDWNYRVELWT